MAEKRAKMNRPAPVTELLSAVFRGTPTEKRLKEGNIWLAWEPAVGPQIAARARPVGFREGMLTVAVSSSPWMQQLNFLKKGIMEKLNARLGEELVTEIYLKAGKGERAEPAEIPARRSPRPLTPKDMKQIAAQTDSVADPELRKALEELLKKHLETGPS